MYGIAPPSRRATTSRNTSSSLFIHAAAGIEFAGHGACSRARIVQIRPSCSRQAGWTSPGSAGLNPPSPSCQEYFPLCRTSSILYACTYWADAETGLKWDRWINERIAEMVARAPDRFVGLGSVPLRAPTRSDCPPRAPQGHCERTDPGLLE